MTTKTKDHDVMLAVNSLLSDRAAINGGLLGYSHGGTRDIYQTAGYRKILSFDDYYAYYLRHGVAHRVVVAAPNDTWMSAPEVRDGPIFGDASDTTPFVEAWDKLATGYIDERVDIDTDNGVGARGILHYLNWLDRIAGIGQYGVLLLGIRDGKMLDQPLERGTGAKLDDLLYLSVYHEGSARIEDFENDPTSPRFGLPRYYMLEQELGSGTLATMRVHWSRCVHVIDNADTSEIYGTPRMKAVFNDLYNLEKVLAAVGEAAWKLLDSGVFLSTKEGHKLPTTIEKRKELEDQASDFVNNLRRLFIAEGVEMEKVPGQVTDPTALVDVYLTMISAATGIPKRILIGAERGELASNQDERAWDRLIRSRRQTYAETAILRPLIKRLVYAGVLPMPTNGGVSFQWPSIIPQDDKAEAETARLVAETIFSVGGIIDPESFIREYFPRVDVIGGEPVVPTKPDKPDSMGITREPEKQV